MVFISLFIMLISGALLFWLVAPPAVPPLLEENPLHPEEGTLYPPAVKADDLGHLHLQD